jgi:catechol 2,3-dioxygenase-like lactoylglutathione lyase family enzyme
VQLRRIDHVGVVVADLATHVATLQAMGLSVARTNDNPAYQSHAEYLPCGDTSIELIEIGDPAAREPRLPTGEGARIEHIAFEVDSPLEQVRDELQARGVEVTWPPIPSGDAEMIWTEAATSGGVQYQFLRRPAP